MKTAKAGLYAFEEATSDLYKASIDFNLIPTAGMTDYYITKQIIRIITGREPSLAEANALLKHYEELLPVHLAARQGYLNPSVLEILEYYHQRSDYISLLLTGNTHAGATAKLSRYEIIDYFNFSLSAFGDIFQNRLDIAADALQKVKNTYPDLSSGEIFVIGDTPNDISCGKSINAKTIAVATGRFSLPDLVEHAPWWALESLPSPVDFENKINSPT